MISFSEQEFQNFLRANLENLQIPYDSSYDRVTLLQCNIPISYYLVQNGYNTFVLSDINNTSACIDAIRLAQEKNLKPIVGIDFRNNAQQQYIGIANNNEGFKELNEHLSLHLHNNVFFNEIAFKKS